MRKNTAFKSVQALALASMLTAMSVVIGWLCKIITFLNFAPGLRITLENIPIILSGVLMGPVAGALVGCASDLLSCFLSATTPIILVNVGATSVGLVAGLVSWYIVKKHGYFKLILSGSLAHIIGSMIIKTIGLFQIFGVIVLWRFLLYPILASIEIAILCWLFKRNSFRKLVKDFIRTDSNKTEKKRTKR